MLTFLSAAIHNKFLHTAIWMAHCVSYMDDFRELYTSYFRIITGILLPPTKGSNMVQHALLLTRSLSKLVEALFYRVEKALNLLI